MKNTLKAAAIVTVNAPGRAVISPKRPRVSAAPAPAYTAPAITAMLETAAARVKRTIRVATAVPKTLAASLAPSDHPRNRPPDKNNNRDPKAASRLKNRL